MSETAIEAIDLSQTQFNSREEMLEAHRQMQADAQELLASLNLPASSFKLSIKNSNGVEIEITDTSNRAVEPSKEAKEKAKTKPFAAIKAQRQVAALQQQQAAQKQAILSSEDRKLWLKTYKLLKSAVQPDSMKRGEFGIPDNN